MTGSLQATARRAIAIAAVVIATAGCSDPLGSWEVTASASGGEILDQNLPELSARATVVFSIPEDETGAAFYRLTGEFFAMGDIAEPARLFVRAVPQFDSLEGPVEQTTFTEYDEDGDLEFALLIANGSIARCDEAGPCERTLDISAGWRTAAIAGVQLDTQLRFELELRGSGSSDPPAEVTADVTLE